MIGFAADKQFITSPSMLGIPTYDVQELHNFFGQTEVLLFVAVGGGRLNRDRTKFYTKFKEMNYKFASYVSSQAFVWYNVKIGENCFILENNTLQPFVEIGNNVIIWSGNHIGHRTKVYDHCFISSHCVVSGFCEIGESSFLGVNCTIEDEVQIASDNFLGASSLIQKNTDLNSLFQCKQTDVSKVNTHRLFKLK